KWNIIATDKRFKEIKEEFLAGEVTQYQLLEKFESVIPEYNDIYDVIESKTISSADIEKALKTSLLEKVARDLEEWEKTQVDTSMLETIKKEAVSLWIEYHRTNLENDKSPDLQIFEQRYEKIFQSN